MEIKERLQFRMIFYKPIFKTFLYGSICVSILAVLLLFFCSPSYLFYISNIKYIVIFLAVNFLISIYLGIGKIKILKNSNSSKLIFRFVGFSDSLNSGKIIHYKSWWSYNFTTNLDIFGLGEVTSGMNKIDLWIELEDEKSKKYYLRKPGRFWEEIPDDWTYGLSIENSEFYNVRSFNKILDILKAEN